MTTSFDAKIEGNTIRCTITVSEDIAAPTYCFSILAPSRIVSGGTKVMGLGGYTEAALPDLIAGVPHEVVVGFEIARFVPANRAWLPMGNYLRHDKGLTILPDLPAGVNFGQEPAARAAAGLGLCPPPCSWAASTGFADLSRGLSTNHEAFTTVGEINVWSRITDAPFLSATGLELAIEHSDGIAPEGYELKIEPERIHVAASDRAGIFYAAITLRNLQIIHGGKAPCGTIVDAPRFAWRGQHLDCARHFFEVETIQQLLELMAIFKLNRFHWHFADDEAFRLEVECYPDLWKKTAIRGEGRVIPGVFGGGVKAGGSYSKNDAKALIAHAKKLNIEVLPEIEVPAHALAMNRAIDGLRDPGDNGAEESVQGYKMNTINPALPKMWEVTNALAAEVAAMFPFAHLHLGCDELPEDTWSGSPMVSDLKKREGLETTDDVQGWTMARIAKQLAAKGIRPAAWEEAARGKNGGIGNGAILFSWTGQGPGIEAARAGYDVVMSPAQNIYLDMAHTDDQSDWGAAWAAFVGLEDTVNWSPVPDGASDIADRIIGVEGTFWGEFTRQDSELWPMLMPRMMGVACKGWEIDGMTDGPALRRMADDYRASMKGFWQWHYDA